MQEIQEAYLGREDPLEEGMATRSSVLAWRIPWTEEPGRLQSMGSQRVRLTEWAHTRAQAQPPARRREETVVPGWVDKWTRVWPCPHLGLYDFSSLCSFLPQAQEQWFPASVFIAEVQEDK